MGQAWGGKLPHAYTVRKQISPDDRPLYALENPTLEVCIFFRLSLSVPTKKSRPKFQIPLNQDRLIIDEINSKLQEYSKQDIAIRAKQREVRRVIGKDKKGGHYLKAEKLLRFIITNEIKNNITRSDDLLRRFFEYAEVDVPLNIHSTNRDSIESYFKIELELNKKLNMDWFKWFFKYSYFSGYRSMLYFDFEWICDRLKKKLPIDETTLKRRFIRLTRT